MSLKFDKNRQYWLHLPFIKLDDILRLGALVFGFQPQCLVVKFEDPFKLLRGAVFKEVFGLAGHDFTEFIPDLSEVDLLPLKLRANITHDRSFTLKCTVYTTQHGTKKQTQNLTEFDRI